MLYSSIYIERKKTCHTRMLRIETVYNDNSFRTLSTLISRIHLEKKQNNCCPNRSIFWYLLAYPSSIIHIRTLVLNAQYTFRRKSGYRLVPISFMLCQSFCNDEVPYIFSSRQLQRKKSSGLVYKSFSTSAIGNDLLPNVTPIYLCTIAR